MRIFNNFAEANAEIERELHEMGLRVHPETMQDKDVANDPGFETLELQNYCYTIKNVSIKDAEDVVIIRKLNHAYVAKEFYERMHLTANPGESWLERKNVWQPFLEKNGKFSYIYSERLANEVRMVINELKKHPNSRQCYIPIFKRMDMDRMGNRRIPCSLGYWIYIRKNKVHLTYMMRSCDFQTHFPYDVEFAILLIDKIAKELKLQMGDFTHFMGSLHIYKKDAKEGVF